MSATLVHFGSDESSRLLLLKRDESSRLLLLKEVGYRVHDCGEALPKLNDLLREDSQVDAILFSECRSSMIEALRASRNVTSAPIIAFEGADSLPCQADFDLVVKRLTHPQDWLKQIEALIRRTQQTTGPSKTTRQQSSELRAQSASLRESSATHQAGSMTE